MSTRLRRITREILDLIYPPRCAGCGRVDSRWCSECDRRLRLIPLDLHNRDVPYCASSASTGAHDGLLQHAVHALKYEGGLDAAPALADRLVRATTAQNWSFDMIIPVPLHIIRQRQRGYNQCQVVGSYMAQSMAQPIVSTALERTRNTLSQVGMSQAARATNLKDAFRADSATVHNATILLLDDVMTTGSTLQACAQALRNAGARSVLSLTITEARI